MQSVVLGLPWICQAGAGMSPAEAQLFAGPAAPLTEQESFIAVVVAVIFLSISLLIFIGMRRRRK